jgi:hypothetical protein
MRTGHIHCFVLEGIAISCLETWTGRRKVTHKLYTILVNQIWTATFVNAALIVEVGMAHGLR